MCPFDIFYRPTRYYFLRVFRNIIFSPFYKVGNSSFFLTTLWHCIVRCGLSTTLKCVCLLQVLFVDSFLADQLTSQVYDMYIYTLRGKKKQKKQKIQKNLLLMQLLTLLTWLCWKITLLRLLESTVCYFTASFFGMHRGAVCKSGTLYWELAYLISFLPYYWRAMQVISEVLSSSFGFFWRKATR